MQFSIDKDVFSEYPGLLVGILVVHISKNEHDNAAIQQFLAEQQQQIKKWITADEIRYNPYIVAWKEAYKQFGAKPKKHLSSIEQLITQTIDENAKASVNPLVDVCNGIALKYLLPVAGWDISAIHGDITLRYATDNESPILVLGDTNEKAPAKQEVFYADERGGVSRRWNWKLVDRTKLTRDTTDALLVIEALPPATRDQLAHALAELGSYIEQHLDATVSMKILEVTHPEVTLKSGEQWHALDEIIDIDATKYTVGSLQQALALQAFEKETSEQHHVRLDKVTAMREQNIEPWPNAKQVTATAASVTKHFDASPHDAPELTVAGRVMSIREHGKTLFAHIQDVSGRVQIYIKADRIGIASFKHFLQFVDVGDIIWISGTPFKTKLGEVTLNVDAWCMLSKCLYPLPDKFHGLTDVEIKYRKRYLDLMVNDESKHRFIARSHIINAMRHVFEAYNFLEVETPMLHPLAGGAAAKPFVTHHNALDMNLYLRIAPELYLKRLVIGGFERVYEINRCFRNEGLSTRHNPEFTTVEFYCANHDYVWMMDLIEEMIRACVQRVSDTMQLSFGPYVLDFGKPFVRMTMKAAVAQYAGVSEDALTDAYLDQLCRTYGIATGNKSWGQKLYAIFEETVESQLINPTYITQFPVEVSPLSKRNPDNTAFVDRFELFIAGMEISNGFNELNDPFDQAERFKHQLVERESGDEEAHEYDAEFIESLEYGLPPTVGAGIGIDRLTMLLTNTMSIRDVILFPTLKKR